MAGLGTLFGAACVLGFNSPVLEVAPRSVLVEIQVDNRADLVRVAQLPVDPLEDRIGASPTVVARIDVRDLPALEVSGLQFIQLPIDLHDAVMAERLRLDARPAASHGDGSFFADYRSFEEVQTELGALAAEHPARVELLDYGRSLEDRPLTALRITDTDDADAPVVVINAGQHAREWIGISSVMFVANALTGHLEGSGPQLGANVETRIESLLAQVVFVVAPVVNPDGYVFSWEEDRFWRKTRRGGFGVDTNRNFSVAFGGPGSSGDPEKNNYRGEAAFSEPETAALRDLVQGFDHVRAHLDVHSFGQLVLYPWGYTSNPAPAGDVFAGLAVDVADAMDAVHGETYVPIAAAELYPAAGNALDWSYGELGAYSITLELRPADAKQHNDGFDAPPSQILPVGQETLASVLTLAEFAAGARPGVPGDDGGASATSTGESGDGESSAGPAQPSSSGGTAGTGTGPGPSSSSSGAATTQTVGTTGATPPDGVSATTGTDTDTSTEPTQADAADGGCGCTTHGPSPRGWWMVLAFASLRRRRRTRPRMRGGRVEGSARTECRRRRGR